MTWLQRLLTYLRVDSISSFTAETRTTSATGEEVKLGLHSYSGLDMTSSMLLLTKNGLLTTNPLDR